jgi:subtilase family serine protease
MRALAAGVVSLLAVAASSASPGAALHPMAAQMASVRPVPAVVGHIATGALSFPPDTAFCRANLGISCYQPFQIQKAYDLAPLFDRKVDGRGRTIVIVDAFGSPTIENDLKVFDKTFGLPDPPSLRIIQPAGAVPPYPDDPFGKADRTGWAQETTLDVEWSHVMAPQARILLVETPQSETEGVQGFPEIVKAENFVIDHGLGDVISQSFGATEETFPNHDAILDLRSAFFNARRRNVTVLASSGDQGATDLKSDLSCCFPFRVNSWPSSDPLVTSMGGTQLHLDQAGNRQAPDEVWNDGFGAAGGGLSHVFERPDFQDGVGRVVGDARGTPDISLSSAVDGGVDVFYSFDDWTRVNPTTGQPFKGPAWHIFGGTSEASPLFAGVVALAAQVAGHRLGLLNPSLYRLGQRGGSGIVDVTRGNNSFAGVTGFDATPGFDLASGWGTIDAARFVPALAGRSPDD